MGNLDKWSTPKQIKIERAGEPRGTRRGILKKGERRKGKKARIDEILSAMNECKRYAKWMLDERQRKKDHPEWYKPLRNGLSAWSPRWDLDFDRARVKLFDLITKAISDLQIDKNDMAKYWIEKP